MSCCDKKLFAHPSHEQYLCFSSGFINYRFKRGNGKAGFPSYCGICEEDPVASTPPGQHSRSRAPITRCSRDCQVKEARARASAQNCKHTHTNALTHASLMSARTRKGIHSSSLPCDKRTSTCHTKRRSCPCQVNSSPGQELLLGRSAPQVRQCAAQVPA